MPRSSVSDVKQIIATSKADGVIMTHIHAANIFVTEILGSDTTITDQAKRFIEMYITAHLLSSGLERELGTLEEHEVGETRVKYAVAAMTSASNLDSTPYGATAKLLDTTGKIGAVGKPRALFSVFGHVPPVTT